LKFSVGLGQYRSTMALLNQNLKSAKEMEIHGK